MDLDLNNTHVNKSTQKGLDPSCCGTTVALIVLIHQFWPFTFFLALSEMESTLLSVVKDRKSQRKKSVFVDTLLQSSLTERQVKLQRHVGPFSDTKKKT